MTVEAGRLPVAIWGAMLSVKLCELVKAGAELSLTWTVKLATVAVLVEPEITPLGEIPNAGGN